MNIWIIMLKITSTPFSLVQWHLKETSSEVDYIKVIHTNSIQEVKDCLLESVEYDNEGALVPSFYLISYTGSSVLQNIIQSEYNTTYLVVKDIKKWKKLSSTKWNLKKNDGKVKFFDIKPLQYQNVVAPVQGMMDASTFSYFWTNYCIGQFNSNPYKWYNESSRLLFEYIERGKVPFTKEDLDCFYGKVSDVVKPYLRNIFSPKSKEYINQMTNNEMFTIFVGTPYRKGLIEKYIQDLKPNLMPAYMLFKESFFNGSIRLSEGVFILDYILNCKQVIDFQNLRYLFKVL